MDRLAVVSEVTDLERLDEALEKAVRYGIMDAGSPIMVAARAYRDLLANGQRVEPDYGKAHRFMLANWNGSRIPPRLLREAVDAAIGDRLLVDYPKEDGRE